MALMLLHLRWFSRMASRLACFWLILACLASACSSAPRGSPSPEPTAPLKTSGALTPAGPPTARSPVTLTVLAAASLTEAFTALKTAFEADHPGVTVALTFAGSQQLAQQISQGAPADVFASASSSYVDALVVANRIDRDSSKTFAENRLVVAFPTSNPGQLAEVKDLAKPGLKVVLAAKEVPAGQYTLSFLEQASLDPGFTPGFKDAVLKNVVSYEENVKSVLAKIALGEADAGIVYKTDAISSAATVSMLPIPDNLSQPAFYPIAPVKGSPHASLALEFINYVLSTPGQDTLARFGFLPVQ